MKKLATIVLMCVLTGAFLIGAFATDAQAKYPDSPVKNCVLLVKWIPVCMGETCRLYYWFDCPYGIVTYWTGEYCPPQAPCWDPNEPQ